MMTLDALSRRGFLKTGGVLLVAFGMPAAARGQGAPSAGAPHDQVDSWIAIGQDGGVTIFTGKVELGTGVETALSQIAAEELDVPVARITVVQGDTARTPDQMPTFGSKTIQFGGPPLRQAAAEARQMLLGLAATRLGVPVERLTVIDGVVSVQGEASRHVSYGELIGGRRFNLAVAKTTKPKRPDQYRVVGTSVRRVDIPKKVTGTYTYLQDFRLPGMLHGRVIRPTSVGATLATVDEASVRQLPGAVKVVRRGNFLGVVAEREEQAIRAARELKATWNDVAALPDMQDLYQTVRATPSQEKVVATKGDVEAALQSAAKTVRATYQTPFQMHGSIGPSCGVADVRDGKATIWTASQGVFELAPAIAEILGVATSAVRCIYVEASGCYGHNGADDAAADAALLSQAVGRPVRVQWMRDDEHGWAPKGPAMVLDLRGGLGADGGIVAWGFDGWTPTHTSRPTKKAGNTLTGQLIGVAPPPPFPIGGDRNARHPYAAGSERVTVHYIRASVLRQSSLRGLGAPQNTFANESFMDELAAAAGADPVQFRLRHLSDPRAKAVVEAAARLARWQARPSPQGAASGDVARGRGIAWAQYENVNAYAAIVTEVEVNRRTGLVRVPRVYVAHDCGLIVNPDGLRNQLDGNVIQTLSRALKEEVRFDRARVTSLDWRSYPILTFEEVPEAIEIELINRPELPATGAGEPAACPVPAAVANAIFDATGARLRTMPFTPERVKAALA